MMAPDTSNAGPSPEVRAFLLGTLAAAETERMEQRLIADEEFYQEVLAAEEELLDELAAGRLPAEAAAQWRQRRGQDPGWAQRMRLREAFFRALEAESPGSGVRRFGLRRWWIPVLAAAACLIVAGAFWLRRAPAAEPVFFPAFIARSAAPAAPRTLARTPIRKLALQFQTSGPGRWDVVITGRAGFGLRYSGLRAQAAGNVSYVTVPVDTAALPPGLYRAELRPAGASATPPQRWNLLIR